MDWAMELLRDTFFIQLMEYLLFGLAGITSATGAIGPRGPLTGNRYRFTVAGLAASVLVLAVTVYWLAP